MTNDENVLHGISKIEVSQNSHMNAEDCQQNLLTTEPGQLHFINGDLQRRAYLPKSVSSLTVQNPKLSYWVNKPVILQKEIA